MSLRDAEHRRRGNSQDVLAIVAPGQGAQTPGFLTPWLTESTFADRLERLSAVSELDLRHYGTEADADTIRDTAVAQPLLVAAGLLAAGALAAGRAASGAPASGSWPGTRSARSPPPPSSVHCPTTRR